MNEAQREMPKYQSHKTVHALKIADLKYTGSADQESDGSQIMTPAEQGYGDIHLERDFIRKHQPHVGGYLVVYADGYRSFSPAKAFEEGYTAI